MKLYWLNEGGWGHVWALVRAESVVQARELVNSQSPYDYGLLGLTWPEFTEVSVEGPAEVLFLDSLSPDTKRANYLTRK